MVRYLIGKASHPVAARAGGFLNIHGSRENRQSRCLPRLPIARYNLPMTRHRFYIEPTMNLQTGARIQLTGPEAEHLIRSLRKRSGDQVILFNGEGGEYTGRIDNVSPGKVTIVIESVVIRSPRPGFRVSIAQAIPKGNKMDKIVREATELGVDRILPFTSERTVPRIRCNQSKEKIGRWQRIALAAAKQSGAAYVPEVRELTTFAEIITQPEFDIRLMLVEPPAKTPLHSFLREKPLAPQHSIFVLIGPEGGFSPGEINLANERGFTAVTLGTRNLRTETVAPVILGILQYELGGISFQE